MPAATKVLDFIWLGGKEAAENGDWLAKQKIKAVLTVALEIEAAVDPKTVRVCRIGLCDEHPGDEWANDDESIHKVADCIEAARLDGKTPILVHCSAGQNRSTASVLAWAVKYGGRDLLATYAELAEARPNVRVTAALLGRLNRVLKS